MFTTRLISGIVLVVLAVLVVGKGGGILFAVTGIISLIGLFELYRALGIHRRSIAAVGYLTAVSYYGILWWEGEKYLNLMIIASLMVLMALYVFTFPKYKTEEITGAFFGVCYVPVMLSYLYLTRMLPDGRFIISSTNSGEHLFEASLALSEDDTYSFSAYLPSFYGSRITGSVDFSDERIVKADADFIVADTLYPFTVSADKKEKPKSLKKDDDRGDRERRSEHRERVGEGEAKDFAKDFEEAKDLSQNPSENLPSETSGKDSGSEEVQG